MSTQNQNISIIIRLFAIYRERIGAKQVELSLPSLATVANALTELIRLYPNLAPLLEHTMVAVNQEYALEEHELQDGDELAVIPPVSGGSESQNGNAMFRIQTHLNRCTSPIYMVEKMRNSFSLGSQI